MAQIRYHHDRYEWVGGFEERHAPEGAGWHFDKSVFPAVWFARDIERVRTVADQARLSAGVSSRLAYYERSLKMSRAENASIVVPAPDGFEYKPFQKAGIAYSLDRSGTLIGDDMGLGKTIQTAGVINSLSLLRTVLIVCPASLQYNWAHELRTWLVGRHWSVQCIGAANKGYVSYSRGQTPDLRVVVCNYSSLSKYESYLLGVNWDLIALDEGQYIKNEKAKRTQLIQKLRAPYQLILSGTPFENRPIELWTLINWLAPKEYPDRVGYGFHYCQGTQVAPRQFDFSGASHLAELGQRLRGTLMVRRRKCEVLKDLPPVTKQLIDLGEGKDPSGLVARISEFFGRHENLSFEQKVARLRIEDFELHQQMSTQLREDGLAKVPAIADHLRLVGQSKDKMILFVDHREVVETLTERLAEFNPVFVYGGMSSKARDTMVNLFQTDPRHRLFIGNHRAAGVGLNLFASDYVALGEFHWNPSVIEQDIARAHRMGQTGSVLAQYLYQSGTLDCLQLRSVLRKEKICDQILN
jgi:SWI/SNF-related matrix-associated actin-dependent regulator 1 of chromatin subfamily A